MPGHHKHDKHEKYAIDIAVRFTVAAIDAGLLPVEATAQDVADFFLIVTQRIINAPDPDDADEQP